MRKLTVGIFTDTFPPNVGGVSNVTVNYARSIHKRGGKVVVCAPWYPDAEDNYPFKVIRYFSANLSKKIGYRVGNPFSPLLIKRIEDEALDIMHIHSPFVSAILARVVRHYTGIPIVFTYHSKFDIDIEKRVEVSPLRELSIQFMMNNINACDAVWVVSAGAGENLKSLGYEGAYALMENGTDFCRESIEEVVMEQLSERHHLSKTDYVMLYVGRMMWYKNLKLVIDGLASAKAMGVHFKMIFIGDGVDREDIEAYASQVGISEDSIFTGTVCDRKTVQSYYSRADLFLFPSTYDTNGIVVREAATCCCPSVLVKGSCAAEGIADGETGILIEETSDALAIEIVKGYSHQERLKEIGLLASEKIVHSWDEVVEKAYKRYADVIANAPNKPEKKRYRKFNIHKKINKARE